MKTNDMVTITSAALGTALLTVLAFWSPSSEADGDALAAKITQPKLVTRGVEMTLAAAPGRTFQAGDAPAFELKAVNTTSHETPVTVRVAMTTFGPSDMLSRMPVTPAKLWQHEETLALKPNEARTITLITETKLPTNRVVSVSLQAVEPLAPGAAPPDLNLRPAVRPSRAPAPSIVALNISTRTQPASPSLAIVRR